MNMPIASVAAAPALTPQATVIFQAVLQALQLCESIHGPEGADYVNLMHRIAHEGIARSHEYRKSLRADVIRPDPPELEVEASDWYSVEGYRVSGHQIGRAFDAARFLATAYARSAESNGGGSRSIEWSTLDQAREFADVAMGERMNAINAEAKADNGFEEDDQDDQDDECSQCRGTGEGQHEGDGGCNACRGTGRRT